ncbi:LOW QUALITY PROTEIN: hypothetical protein NC652_026991 [Populus alba x Populus x berolinensis]|nr:LOW QUALITY PROTEIN: hypothetical protein NC652_026991 [Populus alba x Populus x berolinensis]
MALQMTVLEKPKTVQVKLGLSKACGKSKYTSATSMIAFLPAARIEVHTQVAYSMNIPSIFFKKLKILRYKEIKGPKAMLAMTSMLSRLIIFPTPPSMIVPVMSVVSMESILQYSKFMELEFCKIFKESRIQNSPIAQKLAMLLYFMCQPFLSLFVCFFCALSKSWNLRLFLVKATLTIHFLSRGSLRCCVFTNIVLVGSVSSYLLRYFNHRYMVRFPEPQLDLKYPGILLFLLGNLRQLLPTTKFLLSLRTNDDKEYMIPTGGTIDLLGLEGSLCYIGDWYLLPSLKDFPKDHGLLLKITWFQGPLISLFKCKASHPSIPPYLLATKFDSDIAEKYRIEKEARSKTRIQVSSRNWPCSLLTHQHFLLAPCFVRALPK